MTAPAPRETDAVVALDRRNTLGGGHCRPVLRCGEQGEGHRAEVAATAP